jgi:hypothetical protein
MAGYNRPHAPWLQDLVFVLGDGVVAYGTAKWAQHYGKPTLPALVATGVGAVSLAARSYVQHDLWANFVDGAAGGGLGYGWMYAAANTFGKKAVPLQTALAQSEGQQVASQAGIRAAAAGGAPAGGAPVVDLASRRASVAARGLALGA